MNEDDNIQLWHLMNNMLEVYEMFERFKTTRQPRPYIPRGHHRQGDEGKERLAGWPAEILRIQGYEATQATHHPRPQVPGKLMDI